MNRPKEPKDPPTDREWRSVPGHPDYMVSREGDIWSKISGKMLKPKRSPSRSHVYWKVDLAGRKHGVMDFKKRKATHGKRVHANMYVHRIVALAWHGASGQNTDHLDGDTSNNTPENLAPISRRDNLLKQEKRMGHGDAWEPKGEVNLNFPTEA